MKTLVVLIGVMVLAAAAVACDSGPEPLGREEVQGIVDERLAALDDRLESVEADVDDRLESIEADVDNRVTEEYEARAAALEAVKGELLAAVHQMKTDQEETQASVTDAICTSDYWAVSLWNAVYWLITSYLQGGEATLERLEKFFDGIAVDEEYAELSMVCEFDDDAHRWTLLEIDVDDVIRR